MIDRTPAGRFADPEDVARAVVLLCSADAGFVTAQTLVVDGGYTAYGAAHAGDAGCPGTRAAMPELHGQQLLARGALAPRRPARAGSPGVRLVTLGDGVERGVRVLEFRTGTGFEFDVVVDRAFDIGRCEHAGRALAWTSATGFAGPWFYEPEGLGFFRSFGGGLLTTCGLDHALFMAEDTAEQYHYPPKQTETFGLHGRVSNRPARLAGYGERWEGDECVLYAEGEVLQAAVFGEQLLLRRPDRGAGRRVTPHRPRRGRQRRPRP